MHVCSNQQRYRSALEEHILWARWSGGSTGTRNCRLPEIAGGDDVFVNIGLELTFPVCVYFRWALFSGIIAWLCSEHPRSVRQWLSWVYWRCSKAAQAQAAYRSHLPLQQMLECHRWPVTQFSPFLSFLSSSLHMWNFLPWHFRLCPPSVEDEVVHKLM